MKHDLTISTEVMMMLLYAHVCTLPLKFQVRFNFLRDIYLFNKSTLN